LQIVAINRVLAFENGHRFMSGNGHTAEIINPSSPSNGNKRMPEIVKGGMGHTSLLARSLEGMGDTRDVIPWIHLLRVRLPSSSLAGLTNTHGQRTYLVAVFSTLVNVWLIGIRRASSVFVSVDFSRRVPVFTST
jgi:hypothetical protein